MKFRGINPHITTNLAGAPAYLQSDEYAFVCLLLTTLLKDKFYESAATQVERLQYYARTLDPVFVLQAAYYARNVHGIRSASHLVAGELVNSLKNESGSYKYLASLMRRPDDMLEIVAYYRSVHGKKRLPALLRKAVMHALTFFDEYQLAKYKSPSSHFKMVDLFNLVHPKPTPNTKDTYKKLMTGNLPQVDTWESRISACGSDAQAKKDVWIDLVNSRKIGYFALLRNLRNIVQDAPEVVGLACDYLTYEPAIKRSLVFPFRYYTALKEFLTIPGQDAQRVVRALHDAADTALGNVPSFEGQTLIAIDSSASMGGSPLENAALFGACLFKKNNADVLLFDTKAAYVNIDQRATTLGIAHGLLQSVGKDFGGGTDFDTIFQVRKPYDRIIILSDMQAWVQGRPPYYDKFCQQIGKRPILHTFDLQGYGSIQFPQKDAYIYTGFSDKVLNTMQLVEKDKDALLSEIKNIDPMMR